MGDRPADLPLYATMLSPSPSMHSRSCWQCMRMECLPSKLHAEDLVQARCAICMTARVNVILKQRVDIACGHRKPVRARYHSTALLAPSLRATTIELHSVWRCCAMSPDGTSSVAGSSSSEASSAADARATKSAGVNGVAELFKALEIQNPQPHYISTAPRPQYEQGLSEAPDAADGNQNVGGEQRRKRIVQSPDLEGIAKLILQGHVKRCVVMVGAGISVSAGIPDFRTPGTGLYDNLKQYNLPHPEAIFDVDFFQEDPSPFCKLAKELLPGNFKPTPTHVFLTLLYRKGLLLRCFTQNIDSLEVAAGLPKEKVVAAHGNFDTASCTECGKAAVVNEVLSLLSKEEVPRCDHCNGLVKPDIVFFGEPLPRRFFIRCSADLPKADLAIIMGTSLSVCPFSDLPELVHPRCPRLLINRDVVGDFEFEAERGTRDALFQGDCDDGVATLVKLLGWDTDFEQLLTDRPADGEV